MLFRNNNKNNIKWCHNHYLRTVLSFVKNNFDFRHICPIYRDRVSMQNFDWLTISNWDLMQHYSSYICTSISSIRSWPARTDGGDEGWGDCSCYRHGSVSVSWPQGVHRAFASQDHIVQGQSDLPMTWGTAAYLAQFQTTIAKRSAISSATIWHYSTPPITLIHEA